MTRTKFIQLLFVGVVIVFGLNLLFGLLKESINIGNPDKSTNNNQYNAPSKKWYEGGTLHNSIISEYWSAKEANRLATCADFAARSLKGKVDRSNWEEKVLERANAIKICIEEATKDLPQAQDLKVAEVAASCSVLLEFK